MNWILAPDDCHHHHCHHIQYDLLHFPTSTHLLWVEFGTRPNLVRTFSWCIISLEGHFKSTSLFVVTFSFSVFSHLCHQGIRMVLDLKKIQAHSVKIQHACSFSYRMCNLYSSENILIKMKSRGAMRSEVILLELFKLVFTPFTSLCLHSRW